MDKGLLDIAINEACMCMCFSCCLFGGVVNILIIGLIYGFNLFELDARLEM